MTKITTREQYEWALSRIEDLVNAVTEEMPESDPKKIEYCILSDLVADYSDEHFDLGVPTLSETLRERMHRDNLTQKTVAERLGTTQSKISAILSGKCNPTFETARQMCKAFDIPPKIVLGL